MKINVTLHGETYINGFPFSNGLGTRSPETSARRSNGFVTCSLETSNSSNDFDTRSLKTSGRSNSLVIRITMASLWIRFSIFFCRMTFWETSYAIRSKNFTCSSGHLIQCFQDLFDFICTSLSALNSYFALFKTTRVHKRPWSGCFLFHVADYKLSSAAMIAVCWSHS